MTVITLSHPIEHNGTTITTLNLRRVKLGDVRAAKSAPDLVDAAVLVAARLAGVTPEALDELDAADSEALFDAVTKQLERFRN